MYSLAFDILWLLIGAMIWITIMSNMSQGDKK